MTGMRFLFVLAMLGAQGAAAADHEPRLDTPELRQRAEDLARAASQRFTDILDAEPPQRRSGGTNTLTPVWDWLSRASRSYDAIVIAQLKSDDGWTTIVEGNGAEPRVPGQQVQPQLHGWSGFMEQLRYWLARANSAYRNEIVRPLRTPGGTPPPVEVAKPEAAPPAAAPMQVEPNERAEEIKREAEAADRKRRAEETAAGKRAADEAETKRTAAEAARHADEEKRRAALEEKRKVQAEARARLIAEAEARRQAEIEAKRVAAEKAAADTEAKRKAEAAAAQERKAAEEKLRVEAEAKRQAEEARRQAEEADAAERRAVAQAEAEAKRQAEIDAEATRRSQAAARAKEAARAAMGGATTAPAAAAAPPKAEDRALAQDASKSGDAAKEHSAVAVAPAPERKPEAPQGVGKSTAKSREESAISEARPAAKAKPGKASRTASSKPHWAKKYAYGKPGKRHHAYRHAKHRKGHKRHIYMRWDSRQVIHAAPRCACRCYRMAPMKLRHGRLTHRHRLHYID